MSTESRPDPWYSRGYLPHFDAGPTPQSLTFRLWDSLPDRWRPPSRTDRPHRIRDEVEGLLDQGHGACFLEDPRIAVIAQRALLHFEGLRYSMHAWVIMPNHVHALVTIEPSHAISDVVASWKSYSGRKANETLRRQGPFWQRDYFDRFIRDEDHFETVREYIEANPVRAGLCDAKERWPFGSAYVPEGSH